MIPGNAWSVALQGMAGVMVEVEVALGGGLPRVILVGLPDSALYEARDRCRAAVAARQLPWPAQLMTINLTPATLPKGGSHYDLAIIAALLACQGAVPREIAARSVLLGEVGLDGRVRQIRGLIPMLLAAREAGFSQAIVPAVQLREAELVEGLTCWGVAMLDDVVAVLKGEPVTCESAPRGISPSAAPSLDMADVAGQPEARWALEVAAAGRHHLYFSGPPGVGKTMLASRLPGLLPQLSIAEALEVAAVHSLAGSEVAGLDRNPPYADPHHSASMASIVGGGQRFARPGAVSLAHRGVLFLDEAPEFSPRVLDALRTPLEKGRIILGRAEGQASYPAQFQLVLAANPCPCGKYQTKAAAECSCATMAIRRYAQRISGPILDRIDIHAALQPVSASLNPIVGEQPEDSTAIAQRVQAARQRQLERYRDHGFLTNAEVPSAFLRHVLPRPDGVDLLDRALERGSLSARGVDKVLRLSWTLADLAQREKPSKDDVYLAMGLRRGNATGVAA